MRRSDPPVILGNGEGGAMSGPMRLFVGSYPEFYDRLLVPVLFAPYARIC